MLGRLGQKEGWFEWIVSPPQDADEGYTWYLDGSLLEGTHIDYRATGFGIVVVSPCRDLVAYGLGVPPCWCSTAAAAETLALHMALSEAAFTPCIRTDCQSLLTVASDGTASATAASNAILRGCRRPRVILRRIIRTVSAAAVPTVIAIKLAPFTPSVF